LIPGNGKEKNPILHPSLLGQRRFKAGENLVIKNAPGSLPVEVDHKNIPRNNLRLVGR
jgi:hypothetical protein